MFSSPHDVLTKNVFHMNEKINKSLFYKILSQSYFWFGDFIYIMKFLFTLGLYGSREPNNLCKGLRVWSVQITSILNSFHRHCSCFVVNMKIELLFDIEPIQRRIDLSYIVILDAWSIIWHVKLVFNLGYFEIDNKYPETGFGKNSLQWYNNKYCSDIPPSY